MIQTLDFSFPSCDGIHTVHAREWIPEGTPRGVVQIVHGVAEHIGRYDPAARFLASHGYEREAGYYRAVRPNHDTLVLFCHFGVGCVIISHLLGVSPMILWHGACAAPSSVTTLVTEERREGIAAFRMLSFGDTSHLYVAGEEPSFAARFCETYGDTEPRH